ncbi:MAG TPA: 1-deoxy-D-xylulose-5-phosphate reductoisomerase [Alphaproteobacteria bacterium]|nr:1-deoxy-D-xylulose-5-phosphate reductoisomerase [Rhodospirillaceae bacterium]HRJ12746.1 1-deoxy-D-xylulose-5-phosphate reductoisomerase [Alphaproteobacteria bacterium]
MKRISILGATGSIGRQTLDIVRQHPDKFKVAALVGQKNVAALAAAALEFQPDFVAIADGNAYPELKAALRGMQVEIAAGEGAAVEAARYDADICMAAIVGIAGLPSTLAAIEQGKTVALANKEALVCAGPLMINAAKKSGAKILPVDSEHNAIFQVLEQDNQKQVQKIILTASGGPFRNWPQEKIQTATRAAALDHPNWSMGEKITIDSATMMNKGLEFIEAHYLFDMPPDQIEILVHPQSIIHSMVAYQDGSILAQLGPPDMRVPIGYCLGYPRRLALNTASLDFTAIKNLSFEPPDDLRFPALGLARSALAAGQIMPTALNAANEVAVAAFLADKISFGRITEIIDGAMQRIENAPQNTIQELLAADLAARQIAEGLI